MNETSPTPTPDHSPKSVATPPARVPVYCPVCNKVPLHGKQTLCSPRCRIQRSMARRADTQRERDAKVRLLLRTVIETAQDAKQLLEQPLS